MAETMELLPCPFCGGGAEFIDCSETDNRGGRAVSCTNLRCEASSNVQFGENSDELLAERWNTRATTPMVGEEEIERLRRDCAELYQVLGTLDELVPEVDHDVMIKALDNASAAANGEPRPHDDLLPFILQSLQGATSQSTERDRALEEAKKLLGYIKERFPRWEKWPHAVELDAAIRAMKNKK